MNWVMVVACTTVVIGTAFAQLAPRMRGPVNGGVRGPVVVNGGTHGSRLRGPGMRGPRLHGSRIFTNVYQGPDSLHRPWVGSDTYDKNLNSRSTDNGRSDFQRDRDAALDTLHHEEERARSIRHDEEARTEKMQDVRVNKAVIEANARAEAAERKAREAELNAEIRARAAELESERRAAAARSAEMAARHDAALAALKTCRAYNDNGTPCMRKANPGLEFCYLHVGYSGKMQGETDLPQSPLKEAQTSMHRSNPTVSVVQSSSVAEPATTLAAVEPAAISARDEPPPSAQSTASEHLLVILTVSLISILGIGVLGGLALGFYVVRQRKGIVS